MIEGGLAPFETPFFFILIDPSKGSWRQRPLRGLLFLGLKALPCGPGGFMRGGQPLHPPAGAPREHGLAMLGAPAYFLA